MTNPYDAPPTAPPRRRGAGVVLPVLLIGLGVIFLLQNLGVLNREAWRSLFQLWPLLLVVIGLDLMLRDHLPAAARAPLALVLLGVGAVAILAFSPRFAIGPVQTV